MFFRQTFLITLTLVLGCSDPSDTTDADKTDPSDSADEVNTVVDACTTPEAGASLYAEYPDPPSDCIDNHWEGCILEEGYAEIAPTTTCNVTRGFDVDGVLQTQFWEAYDYARDYFGAYGPVYVYFLGPADAESNADIFRLRAERRVVEGACYPVESQVEDFLTYNAPEELEVANSGAYGIFNISGNTPCNPLMDLVMINPIEDELRTITLHEYTHVFQVAHMLSWDRDSDYSLNSWIMEGQATYVAAKFGDLTGWGPDFTDLMMSMKNQGGNVTGQGFDQLLASGQSFTLDNETYWETGEVDPGLVYYQLGAWAWAYLVYEADGNYDVVLKDFIKDVPSMGKSAAFEAHFGRSIDEFLVEFDTFIRGSDADLAVILE